MTNTSTQSASPYVLGHADAELQRLAEQSAFYADLTEDAFRRAGLGSGMRVLDVGCGAGDVSLLAASIVGPTGDVLGIDRSPDAIATAQRRGTAAELGHVRFEVADINTLAPEAYAPGFDAVVGRLVLLYQPDVVAALRVAAKLARPGGIIVFQEFDMSAGHSAPVSAIYKWCMGRIIALYARAGLEPEMGSKLFGAFQRAGLPAPQMIGACRAEGGPDSFAYRYLAATMRSLLPMFERFGITTATEIDVDTLESRLRNEAVDAGCCLVMPLLIAAWTRTPDVRVP